MNLSALQFVSPDFGALGHVDGDGTHIYRRPSRKPAPDTEFDGSGISALPRVDITYSYAVSDGSVVDALVAAGARGIVSAGRRLCQLRSSAPPWSGHLMSASLSCSQAELVAVAWHCGATSIWPACADNLNPQKARVLLMLALMRSTEVTVIRQQFDTY